MGKKARKTRWRTLAIADKRENKDDNEYSDSEDSNTTTTQRLPKGYQPRPYYNKFSYSSQSTPRRRYQHDSTKSTRSSSTASENKITFNEDEYTKITTPRQDVLFKKGYLNKPKNYQTQTSTGTSTTSTGNSTGNGTPDHQSTDLEYESQFVFPNGFVDQNGIYYINSYETYPLMLYNPPTYYPEFSNFRSKRYSTGSLTESISPNNEEATSQDLSGGEASNNVSDYSGHHQVFNMVYPGYYVNGVCPAHDTVNGESQTDQTRRIKKRRRRKTSKCQAAVDSSEYTEDENDSCDEIDTEDSPNVSVSQTKCSNLVKPEHTEEESVENREKSAENVEEKIQETANVTEDKIEEKNDDVKDDSKLELKIPPKIESDESERKEVVDVESSKEISDSVSPIVLETQEITEISIDERNSPEVHQSSQETTENSTTDEHLHNLSEEPKNSQKSDLKPDAEEFIPRSYRNSEIPINPNLQFIKVPPSFIPIPIMPLGDFNGQNYNATFIPPGIPINFLPPDPKMYPNFIGFVPNTHFEPRADPEIKENEPNSAEKSTNDTEEVVTCDNSSTAKDDMEHQIEKASEKTLVQSAKSKIIDIATIVSKLEEAAKEQDDKDMRKPKHEIEETESSPRRRFPDNRNNRTSQRYKNIPNYRRSHYNSAQNSPQRNIHSFKEKASTPNYDTPREMKYSEPEFLTEQKLDKGPTTLDRCNAASATDIKEIVHDQSYPKKYPESKKNWKYQSSPSGSPKWQKNSPIRGYKPIHNGQELTENSIREYRPNQPFKNYSSLLKNKTPVYVSEQKHERHVSEKLKNNYNDVKGVKTEEVLRTPTPQPKQPNQWISVSSRKKRKNRNTDEIELSFEENDDPSEKELFEKYDVDQLIDVVILASKEPEEVIQVESTEEIVIGDIINKITQNEASLINNMENISLNVAIRSVDDIEKELIDKDSVKTEIVMPTAETTLNETDIFAEKVISEIVTDNNVDATEHEDIKIKSNKKSKKGAQKPATKRVIITDVDLSMKYEELKTPLKKIVTKLNEKSNDESVSDIPKEVDERSDETVKEDLPKRDDEEEKKKNKKKKKKPSIKTTITSSLSSSNTTINNMDDSYDFLLDSALSHESVEKTNVEISQELDKIIQKGMYSSLEEKIKSLNIDHNDGFFKSVFSNISNTKSSVDKNGFSKTPDLSNILQDSRPMFRPSSVSQESSSQNKDINKILPNLDSPVEDGIFLENSSLTHTPQGQTVTKDKQNEETQNEDMNADYETNDETIKDEIKVEPKILYPITEAVKEWMCKTRETTPDVELLKSPDAIYKEFCDSASETDTVVSDLTTLDEEVTIFSKQNELDTEETSVRQQDLMEYWENDLGICEAKIQVSEVEDNSILNNIDCENKLIEQGEDVLEAYESKYGKNEDYLELQNEIKEKVKNSNYPKHGNLPYRAICCSIM